MIILNDILDLSKLESGKLRIEKRPFCPKKIVEEIIKVMEASALSKDTLLKVIDENEIPCHLISDAGRIRQVLFNLVGNAIKFTHIGLVTITQSWKDDHLSFSIQDTGIGIPKNMHKIVFKSFSQIDSSTARKFGGTGLGLAISKRLVELLGGEIGFESEPEKGSRFWFKLPMELAPMNPANQSATELAPTAVIPLHVESHSILPHLRILVVEDNVVNQMVVKGMLKKLGCQIEVAKNGLEAVILAFKTDFDLILMDCHMPEMDGFEATREIRRREAVEMSATKSSYTCRRIIALTANAMLENEAHCRESGMDGFLAKPFKIDALQGILNDILRN